MAELGFNPLNQPPSRWNASFVEQILLVESDPKLRESRCFLLSSLRLPVHAVGYPLEGFQLLRDSRFTLIVLDMSDEEEHASQIAEFVRANWPEAKILLLGQNCRHLDDWLYDDIVDPCCNPAGLMQSAQRLLEWARTGQMVR
jgi:CheY-like chemotaxis protein